MERLNRYLDDLARGNRSSSDAVEPDIAETVDLLRLRDDAPAARLAFADRLLEDLVYAAGLAAQPGAAPIGGLSLSPNGVVPARTRARPSFPLPSVRRAWPLAHLATAAMLVLTVAAVAIAFGILRNQEEGPNFDDSPVYRGGPARTGEQPGPGPKSPPTERWRVVTDGRTAPTPVLADDVLYFGGDDGVVWAVDAESGEERWRFAAPAAIGAPLSVGRDSVYVADRAGTLYALDTQTGALRWQIKVLSSTESTSNIASDLTYAISPVEVGGVVFVACGQRPSAPAVAEGLVFAAADSIKLLRAFDADTGAPLWRYPATEGAVLTNQSGIFSVDAATGQQRWFAGTNGWVLGTPSVAEGVVYVASMKATVSAIEIATGSTLWAVQVGDSLPSSGIGFVLSSSPAVVDGTIYVGRNDGLYALDAATGAERWRADIGRVRTSSTVVDDGMVYVVADGALHAVDAQTGMERWQIDLGNGADASAIVAGGLVFVGMVTEDGKAALVALG
jgi:outer membrane protein assembly factor BamB